MAKNPDLEMVKTLLASHNISYEINTQGKHIKVKARRGDKASTIVVAVSGSDHRASQNLYSCTRRIIKDFGVKFVENKRLIQ